MPLFFESYGDWKLPVNFYLLVPSIYIFGQTELGVRLPNIIIGAFSPLLFYLLIKELTGNVKLALLSGFFLAISPWHIQFSRASFESTPALFFVILATYLFLKSRFYPSFLLFCVSMYTYHAFRIATPIIVIGLLFIYRDKVKQNLKKIALSAFLSFIILIPLITFSFSEQGRTRAQSQSAFNPKEVEAQKIDFDQRSKPPFRFLSGKIYKKPLYYTQIFVKNYLDHFSPTFLFFRGDPIGRHSQVDVGQILATDAIFLAASLMAISKLKRQALYLMLLWLLSSPLAAAIVNPNPNANRAFPMVIPLTFFVSLGAYALLAKFKNKKILIAVLVLAVVLVYQNYLHLLFVHYPKKFAADWQQGQKQMVEAINAYESYYDRVYIASEGGPTYMYFLFYSNYNQKKYTFVGRDFANYLDSKALYVAPAWKEVSGKEISKVYGPTTGDHLYTLWEITND